MCREEEHKKEKKIKATKNNETDIELDCLVESFNEPRQDEQKGRFIGVQILRGDMVVGTLVKHIPNKVVILDSKDNVEKDIHRALVTRMMLVIDGGIRDGKFYGKYTRWARTQKDKNSVL